MNQETLSLISIFVQVPLVFVFMWFVLKLQATFNEALAKRDADWRTFLADRDKGNTTIQDMLAGDIRENSRLIQATNTLLVQHDVWERSTRQ